jgi:hypothetical protein
LIQLLSASIASNLAENPPCLRPKSLAADSQAAKAIWQWTLEERLAQRLDPDLIGYRQCRAEAGYRATATEPPNREGETPQNHSVDGSRTPELLLPHELFESLVAGFAADDAKQKRWREALRPGIVGSGFDEDFFWSTLHSAAGEYVGNGASQQRTSAPRRHFSVCRAAFVALENARQVLGSERFDRFLYEVMAPRTRVTTATSAADPAAELRDIAEGCQ